VGRRPADLARQASLPRSYPDMATLPSPGPRRTLPPLRPGWQA